MNDDFTLVRNGDIAKNLSDFTKERNKKIISNKSIKVQKRKNLEDLFGTLDNLDTQMVKNVVKKKKDEYLKHIKDQKNKPELIQNKLSTTEEIIEDNVCVTSSNDISNKLNLFSDDLVNLDIKELRLELIKRKNLYKSLTKIRRKKKIVKDVAHLEMIINFIKSVSPEIVNYKPSFVYRRINKRLLKLKIDSLFDYLNYIKLNLTEIDLLNIGLSINVTRFMRDKDTWEFLQSSLLPELLKTNQNIIRFWSAATAIGCEAYSLAIINHKIANTRYKIISTDINDDLLVIGKQGYYQEQHVKEMTNSDLKQYFTIQNGDYKVKSFIKKRVNFDRLDLFKDSFPKNLDVILARNIWIYFDKSEEVLLNMYNSLKCNGYLVLGGTEIIPTKLKPLFKLINVKTQTYQKIC